ncbi:MAG TPA: hypothetical protein VFZ20_14700, partial [Longimicrobium sp.]
EMLVDPDQLKVRYLDVDVADDLFLLREDRHVVIPIEAVELRERGEDVWVHGLTAQQAAMLPAYMGGPVDPLVEMRVREAFAGAAASARDPRLDAAPVPPPLAAGPVAGSADETVLDAPPPDGTPLDAPPPLEYGGDMPPPLPPGAHARE